MSIIDPGYQSSGITPDRGTAGHIQGTKSQTIEQRLAALESSRMAQVDFNNAISAKIAEPHERLEALEKYNEGKTAWNQKVIITLAKQRSINEALLTALPYMNGPDVAKLKDALREALG